MLIDFKFETLSEIQRNSEIYKNFLKLSKIERRESIKKMLDNNEDKKVDRILEIDFMVTLVHQYFDNKPGNN